MGNRPRLHPTEPRLHLLEQGSTHLQWVRASRTQKKEKVSAHRAAAFLRRASRYGYRRETRMMREILAAQRLLGRTCGVFDIRSKVTGAAALKKGL